MDGRTGISTLVQQDPINLALKLHLADLLLADGQAVRANAAALCVVPFSGGPLVCMGQYLAVQESMQILATLLQFAELRPANGPTPVLDAG